MTGFSTCSEYQITELTDLNPKTHGAKKDLLSIRPTAIAGFYMCQLSKPQHRRNQRGFYWDWSFNYLPGAVSATISFLP